MCHAVCAVRLASTSIPAPIPWRKPRAPASMPFFGASFPSPFPNCQTGIDACELLNLHSMPVLALLAHISPLPVFVLSFDWQVSPRKLGVMTSRSDRFTTSLTYAHGECRQHLPYPRPIRERPGSRNVRGRGKHGSSMTIRRPGVLQCNFASGTPRLLAIARP